MSFLGAIFSGLLQGFLSIFGVSDAQKLGRAEVENKDLNEELKEKEHEEKVMLAGPRDKSTVLDDLRKHE